MKKEIRTKVCIVGGGPAGIMTGYLLARQGIEVTVLEKHKDFFRDFRGDTIHPSTMQALDELGILKEFLKLPHQKTHKLAGKINGKEVVIADFSGLSVKEPYIALVPQWDFLNFLSDKAKEFKDFHLLMEAEGRDVIKEGNTITGVRATHKGKSLRITADLVIAADGRDSQMRKTAGLKVISDKVPLDLLWFRIPRKKHEPSYSLGHITPGNFLVTIERDTYWQCGLVIKKGDFEKIKEKGLSEFEKRIQKILNTDSQVLKDKTWNDIKLLSVTVDHLNKWYTDGLLCIGDAAHAMSPVGGIGINLAIQDAVAAARILAPLIKDNNLTQGSLKKVQQRREFPTRATQRVQLFLHSNVIMPILTSRKNARPSMLFTLFRSLPFLKKVPARVIGIGIRPEHIE